MRILVATHNYPRYEGDHAGSFIARLCAGLASRGHAVRVVAPHAAGARRTETVGDVEVRRFRYGPDAMERVAYRGDLHQRRAFDPAAFVGIPAMLATYLAAIHAERHAFRPDVVHAHWWFPGGTLAGSASAPLVVTCHGSDVRLLDRGKAMRRLGRWTMRRAAAVTCVSDFLRRDVAAAIPELADRLETIYMPLDIAPFEAARSVPRTSPPTVLFVGNLVPSKGTAVLLDAFARLRESGVAGAVLRIVGSGPEYETLRRRAGALGIEDHVQWAGFIPHSRIAEEYAAATVVVLPSRGMAEGLGLVLAESLLSGTAVIATAAGGIPEVVVDEQTGLIARDGDAAHLAAQLTRVLSDPSLRDRLVAAGMARARQMFAADGATAAFERVYRRCLSRDPS